ncbi:amino acid/amide ABC transporter substrate-binding protein (HAAT family) [Tamaricihabitans halophyticus]|uniref:Amino acid/amide ABC transporter substrate-binding protein (HAAT family) n=1 Tax=Tamaricihabitans halophyticus TaxID=1262583 RepID=A0A4R2QSF4_9PSEU|nr:ABC transporter substrate-binding protein [Tamaricihabitans halophyticus]TCP49971.1 amino acid/amide ABC transporter substrate-binding protein (HAAT family) [Tamaricihabitans halophyticus]
MKRWVATSLLGVIVFAGTACTPPESPSEPPAELARNPELRGDPVVVGVQSPHDGPAAYPQSTYGAEAAAWYINHELGGIDGRPVEMDICRGDGSPETAINCANEFVRADVPVVFDAYDGESVGPMVPVMRSAGIPIVGLLAGQGVAEANPLPTSFYFSGPLETSALGMVTVLDRLNLRDSALAVDDKPASHSYVDDLVRPMGQELNVRVNPVYTDVTDMNFTEMAALELVNDPDVAGIISLPEDGCTGLVQAIRQQGYDNAIFAGSCSQFIDELDAEDAQGAIIQPRLWIPESKKHAPPEVRQELEDFEKAMSTVGYGDELSARSLYSFAGLVNLARILGSVEQDISGTTVATAMRGLRDFDTFAGPEVTCDGRQWPGRPGACSHQAIFFEVQEDGSVKPIDDAGFIELDPNVTASR